MNGEMTPEAKAAVMQLMGQTYGQIKKQDELLVGSSGNLSPKSTEMKNIVENLLRTPVASASHQLPQQSMTQAVPPERILPKDSIPMVPEGSASQAQDVNQEDQLMLDFSEPSQMDQLLDAVKESNLLLKGIKLQLESSNVRPKRKTAKAKVTD